MTAHSAKRWLAERVPVRLRSLQKPLREELPVHLRSWIGWLGGTPLILFVIQVVTGILLTFYYSPDISHTWSSVRNITFGVNYGWLIRGIHHLAAQLMIITVLLHVIRVFVTQAYRKPREFTWVFGAVMFLLTLGFAFTGYSLVYDQLSYWATTVGTNLIATVPLIGRPVLWMIRGGRDVNPNTLARFYDVHIGVIPSLFVLVLAAHLWLVRLHGVARLKGDPRRQTYLFYPEHLLREAAIGVALLLVLVVYAMVHPPSLGPPADPSFTPSHIRPEWYFYPSYRWLKLVPTQVGVWTTLAFVLGMVFWPWIDDILERFAPRRHLGVMVGCAAFLFTLILLVWEAAS